MRATYSPSCLLTAGPPPWRFCCASCSWCGSGGESGAVLSLGSSSPGQPSALARGHPGTMRWGRGRSGRCGRRWRCAPNCAGVVLQHPTREPRRWGRWEGSQAGTWGAWWRGRAVVVGVPEPPGRGGGGGEGAWRERVGAAVLAQLVALLPDYSCCRCRLCSFALALPLLAAVPCPSRVT